MVIKAPSASEQAQKFIDWVKAGKTPPTTEPLTPEIAAAVEATMESQDEVNKEKIRLALDTLKALAKPPESKEWSLAFLFEWAQSDLMKWAPKLIDAIIDPELNAWKPALTGEQRENIKLALIDRVVSGAVPQAVFGTLRSKFDAVTNKFKNIDLKNPSLSSIDSLTKDLSLSSIAGEVESNLSMVEMVQKHLGETLTNSLAEIRGAYESSPQPTGFSDLLMHPKALADYKAGEDIRALLDRSGNATVIKIAYRETIKQKIRDLESTILSAEWQKDKVMDFLTKLPESFSDKLLGSLDWLMKIPIIGDLIAAFFGYNSGKTLVEDLRLETRDRKSVGALLEHGVKRTPLRDASGSEVKWSDGKVVLSGSTEKGSENGKIPLLQNIDFTGVDYRSLKEFYKILKKQKINPNAKDFWKSVFVDGRISSGEGAEKKTIKFGPWDSRIDTTASSIITKLNTQTTLETPLAPIPAPAPSGQTRQADAPPLTSDAPPVSTASKPAPTDTATVAIPIAGAVAKPGLTGAEKKDPPKADPATTAQPEQTLETAKPKPAAPVMDKPADKPAESPPLAQALSSAFMTAPTFPFEVKHSKWIEIVSSSTNILTIGSRNYTLVAKVGMDIPAKSIALSGDAVTLTFPWLMSDTVVRKPKTEFAPYIDKLLTYNPGERQEIKSTDPTTGKENTLVITRTA
jgi:hypothetical protein